MNVNVAIDMFLDAFAHRLLPIFRELELNAMVGMSPVGYEVYVVAAGLGAIIASAILYAIGVWLRRMPERISTPEQRERIEKIRGVATEWLPWLLILSPTPFGGVLIIAAGFFAIRKEVAALMIIVAEVVWRFSPML